MIGGGMQVAEQVQNVVQSASSKIAYATSGTSIAGGSMLAFLDEHATAIGVVCVIVGTLVGILTCAVNWYYQQKRLNVMREK